MRTIKARLALKLNLLLGAIVGILTGCAGSKKAADHSDEVVAMYGIPMASYQVSGKISNADRQPVRNAQVVVKGYKNYAIGDTIVADEQGRYNAQLEGWPCDSINIVATDPQSGKTDSVQVKVKYDKQEAWNSTTKPVKANVRIK